MVSIIVAVINGVVAVANVIVSAVLSQRKKQSEQEKTLLDGVLCLLRLEIINAHGKYTKKGFCPIYAKESITRAYTAYHTLGGNGVASTLYDELLKLPEREV